MLLKGDRNKTIIAPGRFRLLAQPKHASGLAGAAESAYQQVGNDMKKFFFATIIGFAAIALLSTPAFAKRAAASPAPSASASPAAAESPAAQKSRPFHGMVASVDAKAKTFRINGKKDNSRVFKISDQTVITKTGAPATMKDIVENEEVRGAFWKEADGSFVVRTLKLGPLTEQEKAAEDARKSRRAERKAAKASAAASAGASVTESPAASPKP
jgi:hypothetical protein